ncbi:MAG: triose-phosphate isomerase [Bacteroidales bacterium]|nr:triose-phosphate isomerase [Bacteroidales bacterium]MDD2322453.1 triose-phosphate isomerase [Bacteroidales bacterium]MDD3010160.1 triose-phosphate isomerase [Bacteroidales bacterium]MDD3961635.1 triose-phosphate isomerase [Bacteroidales bacterium]MDY0285647.1 triose-phosphate isomerase [Bacteroidales bacterium]
MRKNIVAGNWKMNLDFEQAEELMDELAALLDDNPQEKCEVVICPPALYLELAVDYTMESEFDCGAQNVSSFDNGAYTGEISAAMLEKLEVSYVIIGHSERRKYFHEDDGILDAKVKQSLKHHLIPIFCCGELLAERESNTHFQVVEAQLKNTVLGLDKEDFKKIVIAYEPVWAIGTGKTATPEQAQEMHAFIRNLIAQTYDPAVAENISILYGGSCNPGNAAALFSNPDVDGGLIGGASLNANDFLQIIQSF